MTMVFYDIMNLEVITMDNFICKVANRDELLKRWEYLVEIHPGNNKWEEFKELDSPIKIASACSLLELYSKDFDFIINI